MNNLNWKVAYAPNSKVRDRQFKAIKEIEDSIADIIPATVPGCIEKDLTAAGKLPPLYYSTNALQAQKLENLHLWYYTRFEVKDTDSFLRFEGIDTIADIYVNGSLCASVDNMFLPHEVYPILRQGENELIVHIKPVCIEARKDYLPSSCTASKYQMGFLKIRKAAHMYGWDIMPRIVSGGLWKGVTLEKIKHDKINEAFAICETVTEEKATVKFHLNTTLEGDFARDYTVRVRGKCRESSFTYEAELWHNISYLRVDIENPLLWWPKNYGEQNLYDTTVELYYGAKLCDSYRFNFGIRTVELDRTDYTDEDFSGEFCFKINGRKVFCMGTNWVPMDALHCKDGERLEKALELLNDIGCNTVRCWGGNVYESEKFYDFCDKKGIMIWQDFAMACAVYPQDEDFIKAMKEESEKVVKRLRNHSSIILWSGDNECDWFWRWGRLNPNQNYITREVLRKAVEMHDSTRPFLPSSPYISEKVYNENLIPPENHLWGPRDYFKGEYYKNPVCHFASEIGYHGFPSVSSLKKFLKNPEKIFIDEDTPTDEYLVHASCMETKKGVPHYNRIALARNQVRTLFGKESENLSDFVKQSQISQAEAKKYFIERFRIDKWKKTGIIWWNLIDGWPQISDAVVDYYYNKKLAYKFIKRSQMPLSMMLDEYENSCTIGLFAVNDLQKEAELCYSVKRVCDGREVLSGKIIAQPNSSVLADSFPIAENEKNMYLVTWETEGKTYSNHYYTNISDIDYTKYMQELSSCGFDEFEE